MSGKDEFDNLKRFIETLREEGYNE